MKIRNNDLRHKSIDIDISDCVTVSLHKEEYDELVRLLLPEMKQEIKAAISLTRNVYKRREECRQLLDEIRGVFYNCNDPWCSLKDIKEISEEELEKILDKHSDLLGFD